MYPTHIRNKNITILFRVPLPNLLLVCFSSMGLNNNNNNNNNSPLSQSVTGLGGVGPTSGPVSPLGGPVQDQPDPDNIKMFVGQVPRSMDENDLRRMFEEFGRVHTVNVLRDKATGASKGTSLFICICNI